MAEFRVARALHGHVLKQAATSGGKGSGKPSQFFGRRFLAATRCWPGEGKDSLRAQAEADLGKLDPVCGGAGGARWTKAMGIARPMAQGHDNSRTHALSLRPRCVI